MSPNAGGKAEPHESFEAAATREASEELGVPASALLDPARCAWFPVVDFAWTDERQSYDGRAFACVWTATDRAPPALRPTTVEFDAWEWTDARGVDAMARDGRLCPDTALAWTAGRAVMERILVEDAARWRRV